MSAYRFLGEDGPQVGAEIPVMASVHLMERLLEVDEDKRGRLMSQWATAFWSATGGNRELLMRRGLVREINKGLSQITEELKQEEGGLKAARNKELAGLLEQWRNRLHF